MSSTDKTVYLISGANRGIGLGLVTHLSKRADAVIYAGARDPPKATELQTLAKSAGNVHVIQLTSSNKEDNAAAVKQIEQQSGHLDVVIANAGVGGDSAPAAVIDPANVLETVNINAIGPLVLFQQSFPLLKKSNKPKFVVVSTILGSIKLQSEMKWPTTSYGSSKAAVNYIVGKIHHENDGLIAFPIHPGWVQTDMGNGGAKAAGLEQAPVTVNDSVTGILSVIDKAERTTHGGKYLQYDGTELPW